MLIHWIILLPHSSLNLTKEFGGKTSECDLAEKMKKKFDVVKKLCRYSVTSINDPTVQIATQILSSTFMRKCHADEVLVPIISLAT